VRIVAALLAFALGFGAALGAPNADALFAAGDFTAAKTAYTELAMENSNDPRVNAALARVLFYENRLDEARRRALLAVMADNTNQLAANLLHAIDQRRKIAESARAVSFVGGETRVPLLAVDPLPLFAMKLNGRDVLAFLDTGAPDIVIDPGLAQELGVQTREGGTGTFAGGQKAAIRLAEFQSADLGGAHVGPVSAAVLPTRGVPFFGSRHPDAIVGTVFLSRFLATVDYPGKQLILRQQGSEPPVDAGAVRMPFWLVGDHFIFTRGSVNSLSDQLFLVDSGGAGVGFSPEANILSAAGITVDRTHSSEGLGGGGMVRFFPVRAGRVCLSTACQKNVPGVFTPAGSPLTTFPFHAAGVVSHEFLKHYAVTYDFSRMSITLQPSQR